jgi:hypothetical protein
MANILAEIELNDKQIKAFNEELNRWKDKTKSELSEQVKSEMQTEFDVKVRQLEEGKANFEKEQKALVEEIKTKMQKVMVKRFTSALKEMYDELKVEARKEVMNDPRILALEEVKNVVYPLMDETVTKGYVDELATALKMVEAKEDENDRLKARIKLKEITSTLSPVVAEAVEAFVGDAATEEEVVEKYSRLKNLVNEASDEKEDDEDEEEEDEEGDEDEEDGKKKDKKKKKDDDEEEEEEEPDEEMGEAKEDDDEDEESDEEESDEDDEEEEDDEEDEEEGKDKKKGKKDSEEVAEEELEINPSLHFTRQDEDKIKDAANTLNELLDLAGVPRG